MIWEMRQIILGIHILLAILWVGGVLFVGWGVFPAAQKLAYDVQRKLFEALMRWTHWIFTGLGAAVIFTGVLLGTVFGPLRTWNDVVSTTYGNIWLTALVVGIFTLLWGIFFGYRYSMKVFINQPLWENAEKGHKKALYKTLGKLVMVESVEGIGFVVLIYLMVAL